MFAKLAGNFHRLNFISPIVYFCLELALIAEFVSYKIETYLIGTILGFQALLADT